LLTFLAALTLAPASALAQVRTEDRVAAESLFAEGRQLLQAGDDARACTKLEASRRLEPALGTSLNLADCYERLGRTASAWAEFKSAAAAAQRAGDTLRRNTALERAAALEPRLSWLRIELADASVSVLRNGEPLSSAVIGGVIPVDPGFYHLEASAPGKAPWSQSIEVAGAGARVDVRVPALADEPAAAASPALSEPPPMTLDSSHAQRTLAWVFGGVGVASLATGTLFAALAASSWSRAHDSCVDYPYQCTSAGLAQASAASSRATLATVGFSVSAAALGTSVVLFMTDADDPESGVALAPARVTWRGSF
jgi:hypothetical protein